MQEEKLVASPGKPARLGVPNMGFLDAGVFVEQPSGSASRVLLLSPGSAPSSVSCAWHCVSSSHFYGTPIRLVVRTVSSNLGSLLWTTLQPPPKTHTHKNNNTSMSSSLLFEINLIVSISK